MELRHLRYFVAVAREENVTRASLALGVAQPSLSRQIRDLECELGFELFEREAKSLRLTDAGRHFMTECEAILREVSAAIERTRAIAEGRVGEVRVGFAPSLTVELIPKVLRAFNDAMPGVKVELHDLSTREMVAGLRSETIDVALLVYPGRAALLGLEFHELLRFGGHLAVSQDHPLAVQSSATPAQVAQETLMVYSRAEYPEYHEWIAPVLAAAAKPPVMQEHNASATLMAAVEAGRGVAIVQSGLPLYTGERLRVLPILPAPPPLLIGVAHRKSGTSKICHRFVEITREAAADAELEDAAYSAN